MSFETGKFGGDYGQLYPDPLPTDSAEAIESAVLDTLLPAYERMQSLRAARPAVLKSTVDALEVLMSPFAQEYARYTPPDVLAQYVVHVPGDSAKEPVYNGHDTYLGVRAVHADLRNVINVSVRTVPVCDRQLKPVDDDILTTTLDLYQVGWREGQDECDVAFVRSQSRQLQYHEPGRLVLSEPVYSLQLVDIADCDELVRIVHDVTRIIS